MKKPFKQKILRWSLCAMAAAGMLLAALIVFSPYHYHQRFGKKMIAHTVIIHRPAEKVFAYLGHSDNARHWSVFVDHISPLPGIYADGQQGSLRRCYCNSNEQGTRWDEEITLVVPNRKRQLRIFNLVDFPMTSRGLYTEQLYEPLKNGSTRLTFTVFYKNHRPTAWEELKTHLASYKMKNIFRHNMNNIKRLVESGS